ncbi:carbon-nitrogen hydrolase [Longimicrobium sp.]|uniref:carbon-nitrogen hydrolase n=1 Tax=Longimicrobium sp. TaxID=2029185 RepID=UPI002C83F086|nr:carbon-nitrogen hydrolase [Longimicrobium sp.]HSU16573.1 carbon-nitrogen hydrolase [Longimicrobium sp.]
MSSKPYKIGLVQLAVGADKEATVSAHEQAIRDAAAQGAQVICLQELFDAPYFCKVTDAERFNLAEPMPGPTTERMQRLAKELGVVIIVPMFEKRGPGVYHNSAAVVDADGAMLGIYRKMHIPDDPLYYEKYYFIPGEVYQHGESRPADDVGPGPRGFRVFDTKFGRIGVLICWDQWYPEAARITALMGAQVLFYPTAIGWHPAEKEEWAVPQADAWRTIQRGHAIANGVYVAAANRVGFEPEPGTDGIEFFGHSFISDPFGRIIAEAGTDPAILVAEVDPDRIEYTRRNWPFLRDRRIDAYGPILNRYIG